MGLWRKVGIVLTAVVFGLGILTVGASASTRSELILELHGADDTIWISGPPAEQNRVAEELRLFADSRKWPVYEVQVQPNRVGLVTTVGQKTPKETWSYDFPVSQLIQALDLNPGEVRFGVKHNRLSAISIPVGDFQQTGFPLEPYPVVWYRSVPLTFRAEASLFPANETTRALALWGLLLFCSVVCAWLYIGRKQGTTGNLTLGLYYAASIATFLVYFLTGLAFIWTWLAPSRLLGIILGIGPALGVYVLTTAFVIADYITRSKGTQVRASLRHLLRHSAVSWIPPFAGVALNGLLAAVLPEKYVHLLGGSPSVLVIAQAAILLVAFMLSPLFLRWVYRPRPLQGHALNVVQQSCRENGVAFRHIGYIPKSELGIANAFVAGILPNYRSIYFTETLLGELDDMEFRAVIAHEIGHVMLRHFWLSTIFAAVFGWATVSVYRLLGIEGMSATQIVVLPATILVFSVSFAAISRQFEFQADRFSVQRLGTGSFLQSALDKLQKVNATSYPKIRWNPFATHPSIDSRVRAFESRGSNPGL